MYFERLNKTTKEKEKEEARKRKRKFYILFNF